jgi:lipid-A-disaccharide synthase-like uncharacterized protein
MKHNTKATWAFLIGSGLLLLKAVAAVDPVFIVASALFVAGNIFLLTEK